MSSRFQRTSLWLCVIAGGMAAAASVWAEPAQSLAERRLSIIKRSSTGIVLLDLPSEQRPVVAAPAPQAATASTNPSTPANTNPGVAGTNTSTGTGTSAPAKPTEVAAPQPAVLNRFFSTMPAPSGRSLQQARRLDAPDQGVPLPFARSAPPPAAEPDVKR